MKFFRFVLILCFLSLFNNKLIAHLTGLALASASGSGILSIYLLKKNYQLKKVFDEKKAKLFAPQVWDTLDIADKKANLRQYVQFVWEKTHKIPESFIEFEGFKNNETCKNFIIEKLINPMLNTTNKLYILWHPDDLKNKFLGSDELNYFWPALFGCGSLSMFLFVFLKIEYLK